MKSLRTLKSLTPATLPHRCPRVRSLVPHGLASWPPVVAHMPSCYRCLRCCCRRCVRRCVLWRAGGANAAASADVSKEAYRTALFRTALLVCSGEKKEKAVCAFTQALMFPLYETLGDAPLGPRSGDVFSECAILSVQAATLSYRPRILLVHMTTAVPDSTAIVCSILSRWSERSITV